MALLELKKLQIKVDDKVIIKNLSLSIAAGEVHALMGPNGSGKSTLASALAGHPNYKITSGQILLSDRDITNLTPEERAQSGLFLAFQYPVAIPGLTVSDFLFSAVNNIRKANKLKSVSVDDFSQQLKHTAEVLKLREEFLKRGLNDGFSGGEKKRLEILQLMILQPKLAILDETDSGLDIDALKLVASGVNSLVASNLGILVITHYQRLLHHLKPTHVHILINGEVYKSGGSELVASIERQGYRHLTVTGGTYT